VDPEGLAGFAYSPADPLFTMSSSSILGWLRERYRKSQERMEQDEKEWKEFLEAHPEWPDPKQLALGMALGPGSGLTKAANPCKVGRTLNDILKNKEIFNRFLRRKHPSNQPFSLEDSRKIWDAMKNIGLDPVRQPGHSTGLWRGPHINVKGTTIHIPVDPRFNP